MTARKSEWVISLTQTEIMLVLASIILILLLRSTLILEKAENKIAVLQKQAESVKNSEPPSEPESPSPPEANITEEVTGILERGGLIDPKEESRQVLGDKATEAVQNLVDDKRAVDGALRLAESTVGESPDARLEKIRQIGEDAAAGKAAQDALGIAKGDAEAIRNRIAGLKKSAEEVEDASSSLAEENSKLRDRIANTEAENKRLGFKLRIGFLPCWLSADVRQSYYHTYRTKYDASQNRFRISPHPHLDKRIPIIQAALAGELSLLRNHPKGWITESEFATFGQKIRERKNRLYGEECRLTTKINEAATGKEIKFIRDKVGLYPIYE